MPHRNFGLPPHDHDRSHYQWLDAPATRVRLNWWRIVPLAAALLLTLGTVTMCAVTMF